MSAPKTDSQQPILALLKQLNREISAQELYVELRRRSQSLGLATIYRALKALKLEGTIQTRTLSNGESFYSLAEAEQHYLTCLNCGKSILLENCPICQESAASREQEHQRAFFGIAHPYLELILYITGLPKGRGLRPMIFGHENQITMIV
ncbi:MAG: transcriptional repressor [Cyanobacteria bacterium QH_2_48_84]|nr:MAG: transcriptional repressor [Cyanobacteria bacterium QH_2_48_84]